MICSAKNCNFNSRNCNYSFFRFPVDVRRATSWAIAAGRDDLLHIVAELCNGSHRLCESHFDNHTVEVVNCRKRLLPNAHPTIFPMLEGSSSSSDHSYCRNVTVTPLEPVITTSVSKQINTQNITLEKADLTTNLEVVPVDVSEVEARLGTPKLSPSMSTQTSNSLSAQTPRKAKLKNLIKVVRNENAYLKRRVEEYKTQLDNVQKNALASITLIEYQQLTKKFVLNENLANFINVQICESRKKPKGRRYSTEYKNECLAMYFMSPKLYKNILSKKFCLPSYRQLTKFIQHIKITAGLNSLILNMLKTKAENFSARNKMCVLCVDEVAIKANLFYNIGTDAIVGFEDLGGNTRTFKPAMNATVFMVRGIEKKWKQPICYYLHQSVCPVEALKTIVIQIISNLKNIGLKVCALVSDMGSNYTSLSRVLGVTCSNPFFHVGNDKIIYYFDPPHLIKATRNNLKNHIFLFEDKTTSWDHLIKFYNLDKQYQIRAAPKLTDSHVYPNNFEKMKVKLATQVLSESVAVGISLYMRFGVLPAAAVGTAEFIDLLDKLFDLLNSSQTSQAKKYNRAFKGLPYQNELLEKCLKLFQNLKVYNKMGEEVTNKLSFVKCWQISIKGLLALWDLLQQEKFEYVFTRRLNQDCVENYFGKIRSQSGSSVNPTPIQFIRAFKKLLCLDLLNSGAENCEGDQDKILFKLADLPTQIENQQAGPRQLKIDRDYQNCDLLKKNFTRHVCGYLINKCLQKHTCDICEEFSRTHKDVDDSSTFSYLKAYENTSLKPFGNLRMPADTFLDFILKLESEFENNFGILATASNVFDKLIITFQQHSFIHPCTSFPSDFLLRLYGRLKLFYAVKYVNRNFKSPISTPIVRNGKRIKKHKLIIWKHQ